MPPTILLAMSIGSVSCIKSTRIVRVPQQMQQARSLNRSELARLLENRQAAIQSLQISSLKAQFVGGDEELGKVEKYIGVPGYILVQRPDQLRITLQNPVTKSSLADLVSDGREIRIWIPRLNKFFIGPASISRIDYPKAEENPLANMRPQHIVPALLFTSPLSDASHPVFLEEESDELAKYYVVGVLRSGAGSGWNLDRRIWVERSQLQVTREKYYGSDGQVIADIRYRKYQTIDGLPVAVKIELQRNAEHYSMILDLERVKVNPPMQASAFQLNRIPSAELVMLNDGRP